MAANESRNAKSIVSGASNPVSGWTLETSTEAADGSVSDRYSGTVTNADAALAALMAPASASAAVQHYVDFAFQKDAARGMATIIAKREPAPVFNVGGNTVSLPLCQAPYWGLGWTEWPSGNTHHPALGDPLTIQDVKEIDWLLKQNGTLNGAQMGTNTTRIEYAKWIMADHATYLVPTYVFTVTLRKANATASDALSAAYGRAGVVSTADALQTAFQFGSQAAEGSYGANVALPAGVDEWLGQTPRVAFERYAVAIVETFIGAAKFPTYYPGGSLQPPTAEYSPSVGGGNANGGGGNASGDSSSGGSSSSSGSSGGLDSPELPDTPELDIPDLPDTPNL